jgi:uncharacterized protein
VKSQLQTEMKNAMKAKDKIRLETIRGVLSEIQYGEMQKEADLTDTEVLAIVQREIKKRKEETEYAEKAGRSDLLEKLKVEVHVLESFLPQQMQAEELEAVISQLLSETGSNMGAIMKVLKERFSGRYDAKLASQIASRLAAG